MTTGMAQTDQSRPVKRVYIVGFAPSYAEVPWHDEGAEFWGLNTLHRVLSDQPWTRWFQLHDITTVHLGEDQKTHTEWMSQKQLPVYMFEDHIVKFGKQVLNPPDMDIVVYPKEKVLAEFGDYFTNSISWMIAMAILEGFTEIGIYGVDMAQDAEYGGQRPSCEYFIGLARGQGIDVMIADGSDLLRSPFLYGAENHDHLRRKMEARMKDLTGRREQAMAQRGQIEAGINEINGAIEDTKYWLRVWTQPASSSGGT